MELFEFLKLYYDAENMLDSVGIVLFLSYLNAGSFILDFYRLVKKKTLEETALVMILPAAISFISGVMLAMLVSIPASEKLERFSARLGNRRLGLEIYLAAVLYLLVWLATWQLWKIRGKKEAERRKWAVSCIPDYIFAFVAALVGKLIFVTGENPFSSLGIIAADMGCSFPLFLYLFLYALMLLLCKIVLLALGIFVCACSGKITCFPWREGKDPVRYFIRYAAFYQNASLRCTLMFWLPVLALFIGLFAVDGEWEFLPVILFFCVGATFFIMGVLRPVIAAMGRWKQWGDQRRLIEQFCREYFLEKAVIKSKDFTITRHFLIDEQRPVRIYYWEQLKDWSRGWRVEKRGWVRELRFLDGQVCTVFKEDDCAEELFCYAGRYWEQQRMEDRRNMEVPKKKYIAENSAYEKAFQFFLKLLLILFFVFACFGNEIFRG